MKTKLIATTLLVGALTTSVLAHGNNMQGMNCMNGQMMEQGMKMHNNMNQKNMMHGNMKGHQNMMNCNMSGMMGNSMMYNDMSIFPNINLSNEQKAKLSSLQQEMHNEMNTQMNNMNNSGMMSFITKNGFDKESFKKTMNDRHQTMMNLRANHMEKVLNVLTKEQLAQLNK
ncbi:Spy/CpxP family protein refolding chaperone [Halarcobacter sp.]|jgi:Spy/CpxP family protein refolding chaperone|uniref:Spy/CpxP family protein refolding chaperone n=1 Tax=Arcobacteraceae TaxID=2808963 RepID=UPI003A8D9185